MAYGLQFCLYITIVIMIVCSTNVRVSGQVASLCRPNEMFLSCGGCQKTCREPAPACTAICREGCYCPGDLVRNDTGHCIPLADCPPSMTEYELETSEPIPYNQKCPKNEEYKFCETCNRTCDNPVPICPAQCNRGCFCKEDLVRDRDGKCVKIEECRNSEISNYVVNPYDFIVVCGLNKVFKNCENCERTCNNQNPVCTADCKRGCFCKDGLVKTSTDECVTVDKCPKVRLPSAAISITGSHEVSVEDCGTDEEYLACGWCEPTCSDPHPHCPIGVCTRGCLCKPPLLRHYSGQCVEPTNCSTKRCPYPNEEYVCRYGCEARCGRAACGGARPRGCALACHCRRGTLRHRAGLCVPPDRCGEP